jgi:hypothetical protein
MHRIAIATYLAFAALTGCVGGQLDPRAQRALDVFDCSCAAVSPYVGEAIDVAELVTDAVKGRASIPEALRMLGASADDVQAVRNALAACLPPPPPAPLEPEPEEYRAAAGAP